ncbi:MAG: dienelactone hydrolase family protein [Planctomycetes bacterium]|nr:dienelactone hydrolase family protein [Planctomycetota bacterium]
MKSPALPLFVLLAATTLEAAVKTEPLQYTHGDVVLEGYLAYDDASGERRPGVLVCHEWKGHGPYVRRRAEMLAQMGYIAFALDMYGKGVFAKSHDEAAKLSGAHFNDRKLMRERAATGLAVLTGHRLCDPGRVAAIGYCFGGTTVLELARSGAELAAVVSFHGILSTPHPEDAKKIKAKVLICHGAEDGFIPEKDIAAFHKEMKDAGVDYQFIAYGGAVHSFTVKEAGVDGASSLAYNEKADRRSWEAMKGLFEEAFE